MKPTVIQPRRSVSAGARRQARLIIAAQTPTQVTSELPVGSTNEEVHAATVREIRTAFLQRAKDDQQRFQDATDSEFWLCVCFQSRDQKEAFLAGVSRLLEDAGLPGVESNDKYVHGDDIASALNIELPPARFVPPGEKVNKELMKLGVIGRK